MIDIISMTKWENKDSASYNNNDLRKDSDIQYNKITFRWSGGPDY